LGAMMSLALVPAGCDGPGGDGKPEQRVDLARYFEIPESLTNTFQAPGGFKWEWDLVVVLPIVNGGVDLTGIDIPSESGFELRSVDGLGRIDANTARQLILHMTVIGDGPTSRLEAVDLEFRVDGHRFRSFYPITMIVCHGPLGGDTCNA